MAAVLGAGSMKLDRQEKRHPNDIRHWRLLLWVFLPITHLMEKQEENLLMILYFCVGSHSSNLYNQLFG